MVINIIIIVGLLLAFVTGFFVALKSVQLGLRWQVQVENKESPTIAEKPIDNAEELRRDQVKYTREQIQEWMFGGGE